MDWLTRKLAYFWLKTVEISVNGLIFVYSILYKRKKQNEIKKIGAYWYYPPDLTGSNLRLGEWKSFFEQEGFVYDNLYVNTFKEFVVKVEKGNWTSRYLYFAKSFLTRVPQMLQAHKYDCIWIDRGIIPFYPRKNAFLEKRLKKVVQKLVVDTTDGGDYQSNPKLMEDLFRQADELTVGYKHLREIYSDRFKVTQIFWTIPTDNYILKSNYTTSQKTIIGWMGSPGNFQYVRQIIPELRNVAKNHPILFKYICRENFDHEFEGIETEHHFYDDDYYKIINSFDIGISPFLKNDLRSKGKIAMKHQEFLLMGTPQVCSPVAISEFVEDGKEVILANQIEDWSSKISILIEDAELREKIGKNSVTLFNHYYTYESQYLKLKTVLTQSDR